MKFVGTARVSKILQRLVRSVLRMMANVGDLARSCIEERFGPDLASGVLSALNFYAEGLAAGAFLPDLPRFLIADPMSDTGAVEIELDDELVGLLAAEACRHSVAVGDLLNHAVFVYLASLGAPGSMAEPVGTG